MVLSGIAESALDHSYGSTINGQMISLPLHGQGTAAIEVIIGQVLSLIVAASDNVFDKQSRFSFAEFAT